MRLCYDACSPANIPDWSQLVALYVDAKCMAPLGSITRAQIRITSSGMDAGNAIDIEPQNANAAFVPGWVHRARTRGVSFPIVYAVARGYPGAADGYTWEDCRSAVAAAGIAPPLWWVSAMGAKGLMPGSVMTQYALDVPPGYDVSYALDHIPGLDPEGEEMVILTTENQPALFVWGGGAEGIPDQATEQALVAAGVGTAPVTGSFYEAVYLRSKAEPIDLSQIVKLVASGAITLQAG